MVLNAKFWSLAVHRYQIWSILMTTFAVRGRVMKLVINHKFIVKSENSKILIKVQSNVTYLKKKLRTCGIRIQMEKL